MSERIVMEDGPPLAPPAEKRRDLLLDVFDAQRRARTFRSREAVDSWVERTGGIASQYRSTNGACADRNLELVLAGRDRLVVGGDWDQVYCRAAVLLERNPELLYESQEDDS